MSISVVIATHERPTLLDRCLRAVGRQNPSPIEINVIDDASTDGTSTLLQSWTGRDLVTVRAKRLVVNGGPARARNRGIGLARGEWVAFTDDDCAPEPDWLAAMAALASKVPLTVAGIGGRVLPAAPVLIADYMTVHRILEPPPSCSYLVTANCMYRRQVLLDVGLSGDSFRLPPANHPIIQRGNLRLFPRFDAGHFVG